MPRPGKTLAHRRERPHHTIDLRVPGIGDNGDALAAQRRRQVIWTGDLAKPFTRTDLWAALDLIPAH